MKVRRPRIVSSTLLFYIDVGALSSTPNFLKPTWRPAVILMKAAQQRHHQIRSKFLHPHQGCLWLPGPSPTSSPSTPPSKPQKPELPQPVLPLPGPLGLALMEADPRKKCDFQLLHLTQAQVEFSSAQRVPKEAYNHSLSSSSWRTSTGSTVLGDFLAL